MRVFIKGGVWKNTEDEILKAAVMKYGKNMWARIASLLPRKSAKQVKARWYEWLDPSIKKTEWTREEEERLLHLAKLMPTQWRTIAPIVGRTAQQCLEHYEKLLDQAVAPEDRVDPSEDPRRLRPGEVDPHPETKPARPDPIDMDEDEKEMLSEARARLANTRGKKAKRKAREKQLEEARRLALLQKRRELKAAGITGRARKKRRRDIDYVTEVPFEKIAPAGFYDTSADDVALEQQQRGPGFLGKNLQQMEGLRRVEEEKRARQRDKKRVKKLQQHNLPEAIMQQNALNDPGNFRKRSRLSMPAPQVTDQELEDIVKYGTAGGGGEGTAGLLAQYGATPGATPMRTPRTPAGRNVVMEEARNLLAMRDEQTPLKGGESIALVGGTGYSGVTPVHGIASTPNVLAAATPARAGAGAGAGGATPMTATPGRGETPLRDELSINRDVDMMWGGGNRAERARAKALRKELENGLASLPAPEYELEIVVPEVEADEGPDHAPLAPDAADLDEASMAQRKAAMEAELKRRSSALQRDPPLPRPLEAPSAASGGADGAGAPPLSKAMTAADELIRAEARAMIERDNIKFPVRKATKRKRRAPRLEPFTDEELAAAKAEIQSEAVGIQVMHEEERGDDVDVAVYAKAWEAARADLQFVPSRNAFVSSAELTEAEVLEAQRHELGRLTGFLAKVNKRATKLEAKVRVLTAGYEKRAGALQEQLEATCTDADNNTLELACFQRLAHDETAAIPGRLAAAEAEARDVAEREVELQSRYQNLVEERERLLAQLHDASGATTAAANGTAVGASA